MYICALFTKYLWLGNWLLFITSKKITRCLSSCISDFEEFFWSNRTSTTICASNSLVLVWLMSYLISCLLCLCFVLLSYFWCCFWTQVAKCWLLITLCRVYISNLGIVDTSFLFCLLCLQVLSCTYVRLYLFWWDWAECWASSLSCIAFICLCWTNNN